MIAVVDEIIEKNKIQGQKISDSNSDTSSDSESNTSDNETIGSLKSFSRPIFPNLFINNNGNNEYFKGLIKNFFSLPDNPPNISQQYGKTKFNKILLRHKIILQNIYYFYLFYFTNFILFTKQIAIAILIGLIVLNQIQLFWMNILNH
jgi:hypothetical protein